MSDQPATTQPPEADTGDDAASLRREATNRRRALREAEATIAERDTTIATLTERLDKADRAVIRSLAAEQLANPDDLFLVKGVEDFRSEDGTIDQERAGEIIASVLAERAHWAKPDDGDHRPTMPDLHQGARRSAPRAPSFGEAVKGTRR